jgi:putative FmdB family regulatory protein
MPVYDFRCAACGDFSVLKPLAARNTAQPCPTCAALAERCVIAAPALARMPSFARSAAALNERSQHEPHRFRAGDVPASSAPREGASKNTRASTAKAFPGKRPWMISH